MAFPTILLIHSCNVETGETAGSADSFGKKTATKTYTQTKCRFYNDKAPLQRQDAGELPVYGLSVILPAGTVISAGKQVVGLSTGFERTYRVTGDPRYALLKKEVSHLICDLEVV